MSSNDRPGPADKAQRSLPTTSTSRPPHTHSWSTENLNITAALSRPAPLSASSLVSSLSQLPIQPLNVPVVASTNILIPALFRQQLISPSDYQQQLLFNQIRSLSSGNLASLSTTGISSPPQPKAASSNLSLSLPSLMQDSEGASSSRASNMSVDSNEQALPPLFRPIARRPSATVPLPFAASTSSVLTATTSAPSTSSDGQLDKPTTSKQDEKIEQGIKKVESMKSEQKSLHELFKQFRPNVPNYDAGTIPATTGYVPSHFMRGTMIKLANGKMKRVEQLSSDDFLSSAAISRNVIVNASIVCNIVQGTNLVRIHFEVGESRYKTTLDVQKEYPFFVLGKGWSSGDPTMTYDRYGIEAQSLNVGDVCIVLTRKSDDNSIETTSLVAAEKNLQNESDKRAEKRAPKRKAEQEIKCEDIIPEENAFMYEI
ncbi:hypothetical protein WR25_21868 [Diploscapter pachys]|uniref:AXH domain-containing protein n=1 Tax=Diploscapter pachys TaxID=2018661 RepID=A0A2A2M0T9_9BILA|nr:hypothetical protein WR25_21868 [Diploscapter pachys]